MMHENDIRNAIDRRLSGLCASEARRQRIWQTVAEEAGQHARCRQSATAGRPVRRLTLLVALLLLLLLTCAAAVAFNWNVLAFLEIESDADTANIVTTIDGRSNVGDWSMIIDSAVTDGEYLAFDWTLIKEDLEVPCYIQVESLTGNGLPLSTDGTDDFHCQWIPGAFFSGNDQGGNLCRLPEGITGDTLLVEMVIGLYRPVKPVYEMEVFDETIARQKLDEGYYVIAEGEGFVLNMPEEGLCHCFGMVNDAADEHLERTEMIIRFTVDLASGKATMRNLPLPQPVRYPDFTMEYTAAASSALQTSCAIIITPDEGTREAACALLENGYLHPTDAQGERLGVFPLEGSGGVREMENGVWGLYYECSIPAVPELPEVISLSYITQQDEVFTAPVTVGKKAE
ncbi:MAG: hypothetical protein E7319_10725 [Clostridiales bacterium]|nr:hypothetical protein [Clostridiales bacterium]